MTGRASTAAHHTPCYAQAARCAMHTSCPFAACSAVTVPQVLESKSCHHTEFHHLNDSAKALFSKAQFFNICCLSSQKEKGSVLYFSKINATVKSWQKIRVTTTLSEKVTGMNSCRANFYFKDTHPTPVMGKTKY